MAKNRIYSIKILPLFALLILTIGSCKINGEPNQTTSPKAQIFYPEVISSTTFSENSMSLTEEEDLVFLTRTTGWQYQSGHLSKKQNGTFGQTEAVPQLDSIYNGAINPAGNKIIFCVKQNGQEAIYLLSKRDNEWMDVQSITAEPDVFGGYFYWLTDEDLYFYVPKNNGDVVYAKLQGRRLVVLDELTTLNTQEGTEFSPFVDKSKRYIIFTRYLEGAIDQQGFFISFSLATSEHPTWSTPQKLSFLPYGWNAYVSETEQLFLYSNGEDIIAVPLDKFKFEIGKLSIDK